MPALEAIPVSFFVLVASTFGPTGLVFVFWWLGMRQNAQMLQEYKESVDKVTRFYENNVILVENYEKAVARWEKLSGELLDVIALNTQTQANLTNAIKNNMFCPAVRKESGQ